MKKYSRMFSYQHRSRCSEEQKKEAVSLYLTGNYTKSSISRDYHVSIPGLDKWIEKFAEDLIENKIEEKPLISDNIQQSEITMTPKKEQLSDKDIEIARLRQELYLSQVKNDILEAMIDIAKEDYDIDLRKKAGPQPYKKLVNKKDIK